MHYTSWQKLKSESPIDIVDISHIGRNIEFDISEIIEGVLEPKQIFIVKSNLVVLLRRFVALFNEEGFISDDDASKKADKQVLFQIRQNMSRLIGKLDTMEDEIAGKRLDMMEVDVVMPMLAEMEGILYGDVYYVLKRAIEREKKDKRRFLYLIYEVTSSNASMVGGEARLKTTKRIGSDSFSFTNPKESPTVKDAMSPEGQKKLLDEFEEGVVSYFEGKGKK